MSLKVLIGPKVGQTSLLSGYRALTFIKLLVWSEDFVFALIRTFYSWLRGVFGQMRVRPSNLQLE